MATEEEGELAEELKALQLTEAALSMQARIIQMKKQIQDTRERVARMKADGTSSEPNDAKSAEQSRTTPRVRCPVNSTKSEPGPRVPTKD